MSNSRLKKGTDIPPVFRGFRVQNAQDWRAVFFYRFVSPLSRTGPNLNYADRLRGADADLLLDRRLGCVPLEGRDARPDGPVKFTLVASNSD